MATTQYILRGKFKWMNNLFNRDEEYNKYSVDFYPTEESWNTYKDIGLELKVRTDEDWEQNYVRLTRKHSQLIKDNLVTFGPPRVYNADGTEKTEIGTMGNGTEGMVKIEVYDTAKGRGHRLVEVAITEEVAYVPDPNRGPAEVITAADVVPYAT